MKKNNKGFTMIELLAVITLLGILAAIAVPAVTKYLTKGRNQSIDTMFKSAYEAAENYMMENNIFENKEIPMNTLVKEQYLEPLVDPHGNSSRCDTNPDSKVIVTYTAPTDGVSLPKYKYKVIIKCPSFGSDVSKTTRTFSD